MKSKLLLALLCALMSVGAFAQAKIFYYTPTTGGPSFTITGDVASKTAGIGLNGTYDGEVVIPSTVPDPDDASASYTITSVQKYGFGGSGITKVTIPATVDSVGIDGFRGCANLASVVFEEGVKSLRYMSFANCPKLATATGGVLTLPVSLTDMQNDVFYNCWGVNSVNFDQLVNLKKIGVGCFHIDTGKHPLQAGEGLQGNLKLAEGLVEIGDQAFANQTNLNGTLTLPSTLKIIGNLVFVGSASIQFTGDLVLPDGLEQIGHFAFAGWQKPMDNFKWPSALKKLGNAVFARANVFGSHLEIPASIEELGNQVFYDCRRINTVTVAEGSKLKSVGNDLFYNAWLNYIDFRNVPMAKFVSIDAATGAETQQTIGRTRYNVFGRIGPYTLVYLPKTMTDESLVPAGQVNFIQNGKCKIFQIDDDHKQGVDGVATRSYQTHPYPGTGSTSVPDYPYAARGCDYGNNILETFTAEQATYVRTLSPTKVMSVMLPYEATIPAGVRAYKLQYKNTSGELYFLSTDDSRLQMDDAKRTKLEAYTPYLLKFIDGTSTASFGFDTNLTINPAPSIDDIKAANTTKDGYAFVGTTQNIYHSDAVNLGAYVLLSGKWYQVTDGDANGFVRSLRSFVIAPASPAGAPRSFAFMLEPYDSTTGISSLAQEVEAGQQDIYSVDGRFMGRSLDTLPKGIYVVKGKKIYKY